MKISKISYHLYQRVSATVYIGLFIVECEGGVWESRISRECWYGEIRKSIGWRKGKFIIQLKFYLDNNIPSGHSIYEFIKNLYNWKFYNKLNYIKYFINIRTFVLRMIENDSRCTDCFYEWFCYSIYTRNLILWILSRCKSVNKCDLIPSINSQSIFIQT